MKKKGASHIEIVLAFVLFVGAVIFIFTFINLGTVTKNDAPIVSYLFSQIYKGAGVNVSIYSVSFDLSVLGEQEIVAIELPNPLVDTKYIRAENYSGTLLPVKIDNSRQKVYVNRYGESFAYLVISEGIVPDDTPIATLPSHDPSQYKISLSRSATLLSEQRLRVLQSKYDNDYAGLKSIFQLPRGAEFGFTVGFSEGDFINAKNDIPARTDVSAEQRRLEILRTDGALQFADVMVSVW